MITCFIIAAIVALIGVFLLQGYRKIPVTHKGQKVILGKRIEGEFYDEGWHFFPLFPYWYGYIKINMEKKTFTVTMEKARTPDRAESKIPVTITFRPIPELLSEYIISRQEAGVKEQLEGKIEERIREWAMNLEEGPMTWIELNQSKAESTSILVTKLAKKFLPEVPDYAQEVPSWIWMRYFSKPRPKEFLKNEVKWARNNWEEVEKVLEKIKSDSNHGPATIEDLEKIIKDRRSEIEAVRNGSGTIKLTDLGIVLERLNIGNIEVLGKVAEQAENEAKEEMERRAEALEIKNVLDRVQKFVKKGFTPESALEAVLVNMGKVPKTIQEKKINASSETLAALKEVLTPTLLQLFQMFSKKDEKDGGTE